ncbi:MAG TPA: phosphotransferase [Microbacteriaceae bacterium]|nr:phosphotransferase [Microbacteriaceae bacterium]
MARPAFTLAALATAALPGLEVASVRPRTTGQSGEFDAAEITTARGEHLIVRVPRTQAAETDQSTDMVALRALTEGARQRLPFDVPLVLGQAPIGPTRGLVYRFVEGTQLTRDALTANAELAASVGRAIAAIHSLPTTVVLDAGLPTESAAGARLEVVDLIRRSSATGLVPAALVRRWEDAADDDRLWQYVPTVINAELAPDSFLVTGDRVNGILGWAALQIGDPARDIHWLLAARGPYAELAMSSYVAARGGLSEEWLPRRALLFGELELARWLMHGVGLGDRAIIDDAVALLDELVSNVHAHAAPTITDETGPIFTIRDVENLLDATPAISLPGASVSLATDGFDRSELDSQDGTEPAAHDAWRAASESIWAANLSSGDPETAESEPAALDPSVHSGAAEWTAADPDSVSTEPLDVPKTD